jgi:hypothetical protein
LRIERLLSKEERDKLIRERDDKSKLILEKMSKI